MKMLFSRNALSALAIALGTLAGGSAHADEVFYSENFNTGNGGWTVDTPLAFDGPWDYDAGRGSWWSDGQESPNGHSNTTKLISPGLVAPANGPVTLTFEHRYSFEYDGAEGIDGGAVYLSVNAGLFTKVPGASFAQNGYNGIVENHFVGGTSVLQGQEAFVDTSPDFAHSLVTSTADLGTFNTGDVLRIQFLAGYDSSIWGPFHPNWEIDTVKLTSVSVPEPGGALLVMGAMCVAIFVRPAVLGRMSRPASVCRTTGIS